MTAASYWDERYTVGVDHHATQNRQIADDFLAEAMRHDEFADTLVAARSVLEVGCGTGELAALIAEDFQPERLLATDLSARAVAVARARHPGIAFMPVDILQPPEILSSSTRFDLCVSSNTIEHFRDPHAVIAAMLGLAERVLLLVPYAQQRLDGYEAEGGAGHAATITLDTFSRYRIIDSFTFRTDGWQHDAHLEEPLQLAVLLEARP